MSAAAAAIMRQENVKERPALTAPSFSRRSCAFLLDAVLALLLSAFGVAGGILAVVYLVFRDGLPGGRSVGKRMLSLRVISRDGTARIGLAASLKRNVFFVLPLLNAAISATVFEGVMLYFDEEGLRLGDRIARTRVVRS